MLRQVVKQPNGKLSLWSNVIDNFIVEDVTKEELIEILLEEERPKIIHFIEDEFFHKSYKDCISTIERVHGKKETK